MANTKDLRIKIDSTRKTQQTTRAMKMVSAAKLRRAQHAIVNSRPYARKMDAVISHISKTQNVTHPLLLVPETTKRLLLVVLTSDRGLCGAFNSNVIRFSDRYYSEMKSKYEKIDIFCFGRRGGDHFRRRGVEPIETVVNLAKDIDYGLAADVADRLLNWYLTGEYDEVRFVFNEFKSALSQRVVAETLIPIRPEERQAEETEMPVSPDIIFEPGPEAILEQLLKRNFAIQVYRCLQESIASEHGARMNAMENATKNAGEMIRNLTLKMNKIRQAAITTELIEITSGAEALNA